MFTGKRPGPRRKKTWVILGGSVLLAFLVAIGFAWAQKTVTIKDVGEVRQVTTLARTVEDLFQEQAINLEPQDLVVPALSAKLEEGMTIEIIRAVTVTVKADGITQEIKVARPTVKKVLELAKIQLGPLDQVNHNLDQDDSAEKWVRVTRIEEKVLEKTEKVPYSVKRQADKSLAYGQTKVVQQGSPGLVKEVYVVTYTDGKETSRKLVSRKVVKEPVPKIVAYGVKQQTLTVASRELQGRKMLVMEATAYTHTGKRTATGIKPSRGVIAVDPQVIPLGTKLYVEGYGYGTAQDTGGKIKGKRIDVFLETKEEALNWGRQKVKVYILE